MIGSVQNEDLSKIIHLELCPASPLDRLLQIQHHQIRARNCDNFRYRFYSKPEQEMLELKELVGKDFLKGSAQVTLILCKV